MGRFLQTDPIGQQDDPNLYEYVKDDPINHNDPLGLETQQFGWQVEFMHQGTEWGSYKESIKNDPVTSQYPTSTGTYLSHSMGTGLTIALSANYSYCPACSAGDIAGGSKGESFPLGLLSFGKSESNGKNTYTIGFGLNVRFSIHRVFQKSFTQINAKTGPNAGEGPTPQKVPVAAADWLKGSGKNQPQVPQKQKSDKPQGGAGWEVIN